jgi:hypothetical protein
MITQASDLLNAFIQEEILKISSIDMPHMPTLGTAFEEITKNGIQQNFVIPPGLDLKVVSGFMRIGERTLPNQIDCMLVHGEGERYGSTHEYFYDVENILAIFEVKKKLNSTAFKDAYEHLGALRKSFSHHFSEKMDRGEIRPDIKSASLYYSKITGEPGPEQYDDIQYLDNQKKVLFYSMVIEQLSPVNIIHGYEGYSTEYGLRKILIDSIEQNNKPQKRKKANNTTKKKPINLNPYLGMNCFPNLITSNNFSLAKTNGYPYFMPSKYKNKFTLMASSRENPLRLMLEMIWTKISLRFGIDMPWGDDLSQEIITPLLFAQVLSEKERIGWFYTTYEISDSKLKNIERKEWIPSFISKNAMLIIRRISFTKKPFNINNEERKAVLDFCNEKLETLCDELVNTSFFIMDHDKITTNHRTTYILDDDEGGWVTTELSRLMQWVKAKKMRGTIIHNIILE